jgi:hypothetical protein
VTDQPRMAAPVSRSGTVGTKPNDIEPTEEEREAQACLPRSGDHQSTDMERSEAVARLVSDYSPPEPAVVRAASVPEAAVACVGEALRMVLTCGGMLALAPESLGASLVAAAPCALQAMTLGQCIAREMANEDAESVRLAAEMACADRGGIPIATDRDVTCFILREPR